MTDWTKELKEFASFVERKKVQDFAVIEAEFEHFQNLLSQDEEGMTFFEAEEVIKDLSILWKEIRSQTKLDFFYDNVAEREGWV